MMPIQPIDLQTLFGRLEQVGKEQAEQKEIPAHHQSLQAGEFVKEAFQENRSVTHTKQVAEGPNKIKEEGKEKKERGSKEREREKSKEEEAQDKKEVFKDPALGQHIDISG
ncbi:MAG: hypothetical protein AB1798_02170 [Spirochaetota bacterium]